MNVQRHDPGILPPHWDQKLYDRKPRIGQSFVFVKTVIVMTGCRVLHLQRPAGGCSWLC